MPQPHKNAPDDLDVYNMAASVGEEFGYLVEFVQFYRTDGVYTTAFAFRYDKEGKKEIAHQALHKRDNHSKVTQAQVNFTLAFDLWCQFDGGGATAAKRGAPYGWNGRPEKLTARKR